MEIEKEEKSDSGSSGKERNSNLRTRNFDKPEVDEVYPSLNESDKKVDSPEAKAASHCSIEAELSEPKVASHCSIEAELSEPKVANPCSIEAEPSKPQAASHHESTKAKPSNKKNASDGYKSKSFEKNKKIALEFLESLRKAESAYRSQNFAAAAKEFQVSNKLNVALKRTSNTFPIAYGQAIASLKSGSLEAIRTNYTNLKRLTQVENEKVYPFIFYSLAKYQFFLKCDQSEVEYSLKKSLELWRFNLPRLYGPWVLENLFPELYCPFRLRELVLELSQELKTPPPPGDKLLLMNLTT